MNVEIEITVTWQRVVALIAAAFLYVAAFKLFSIAFGMIEMAFENGGHIPVLLTFSEIAGGVALCLFGFRSARFALASERAA